MDEIEVKVENELEGQCVVVTGGSSGIGLATAVRARDAGASRVVIAGRSPDKLGQAAAVVGKIADPRQLDVTDEDAVSRLFSDLGPIDHLVTAAAGTYRGKITETDTVAAKALFESKYWGQHHSIKHAGPRIRNSGSITLFSGWISRKPMVATGTLAAIDAAIEAIARIASLELAPVRVNAVVPGMIDTPLWGARLTAEQQKAHFEKVGAGLPVGRAGTAEDLAHAVMFLMTNGFTSGVIVDVDGGQRQEVWKIN